MKSIKFSEFYRILQPEYLFFKMTPNNSIRNNETPKLAKAIASLYKGIYHSHKKEQEKIFKVLGHEFFFGTKWSKEAPSKVSFLVYIEKKKVEFYMIIPSHAESVMREKMSSVWSGLTIEKVEQLPTFSKDCTKYQLKYQKEDPLSLRTDARDNYLLESTLNVLDVMQEGDKAGVFYNFIPMSQFGWSKRYQNTINKFKNHQPVEREKLSVGYLLKKSISVVCGVIDDISEALAGASENKKVQAQTNLLTMIMHKVHGGGKMLSPSTEKKGSSSILKTQILVMSESDNALRERSHARSLTQSFEVLSDDNKLVSKPYDKTFKATDLYIKKAEVNQMSELECQHFLSLPGRELLEKHEVISKIETQETQVPEQLREGSIRIGINTFRGHKQPAYLSTDREFKNLGLVLIGPNRSGKTTFLQNVAYDCLKSDECVVMVDYIDKCQASQEVASIFPPEKVLNIECDDPKTMQGLGYNEIEYTEDPEQQYKNAKRQTIQLATFVDSIQSNEPLSPKMSRYLECASLVVFLSGGAIRDVFETLQDHRAREQWIGGIPDNLSQKMNKYVLSLQELDEVDKKTGKPIGTHHSYIVGILDRLNKLEQNPYMEEMLAKGIENNINLTEEIQKNQLICIKMPGKMFSTDGERDTYALYWMTKIWLALQMRTDKFENRHSMKKVNFIVDELYQVRSTELFLTNILSRLPKYQFKPIISCHYLNQIPTIRNELRSANASYMR